MKLPPLDKVDEDLHLGFSEQVDVTPVRCKHEAYIVDATHARCKKCTAGWQGHDISKLVDLINSKYC